MFLILNKDKIYAYIISISTVIVLFVIAGVSMPNKSTIETSAEIHRNTQINNNTNTIE